MSCAPNRFQLLLPLLALGGFTFAGCSDECERASDCIQGEVCYVGVCTPAVSANSLCQSDLDCNNGTSAENFKCSAGRCVVDDVDSEPLCQRVPECFETGGRTPQILQTMTATTGQVAADINVPMSQVVAVRAGQAGTLINIIAQDTTGAPTRYMCISILDASNACDLIQVSVGSPTDPNSNIYEGRNCMATLDTDVGPGTIAGQVSGIVTDCANDTFTASADFEIAIQN